MVMEGPLFNQVGYPITSLYCTCLHSFTTRVEALPAKILAPDICFNGRWWPKGGEQAIHRLATVSLSNVAMTWIQ